MKQKIPKYKIGEEVWVIEKDLTISNKRIVGYKEIEGKITYELDIKFCRGISEEELSKTKRKSEIKIKNFLDNLKFRVGDLVVFKHLDYRKEVKTIGQITKIEYSTNPYEVRGSYEEYDNISDEDIVLKIKNKFIEDFGNLQELHKVFEEKKKEIGKIINLIHNEHDRLEKELNTSIRKQYSVWHWNKSKPMFKNRFTYKHEYYD